MSPVKYKAAYKEVVAAHPQLIAEFTVAHESFRNNRRAGRKEFDRVGLQLMEVLRDQERKLCSGMERGQYAKFSADLAEKFWSEVRQHFPYIDLVGVESNLG